MTEEYNDNSVLTNGIHKYKPLKEVDPEYLIRIYDNGTKNDIALYNYIKNNYESIKNRIGLTVIKEEEICNKVKYKDKVTANSHINWIQQNTNSKLKPQRSYQCDKCTCWHITSRKTK